MKRYLVALVALTLLLAIVSVAVKPIAPQIILPVNILLAVYFAIITGVQHFIVVKSFYKSPRRFVQIFLASTVATLFIHLAVLAFYLITRLNEARSFTISFAIGFATYLVFETTALVLTVNKEKKKHQAEAGR